MDRREERRKLAYQIDEQSQWMTACGGDLEGYRRTYIGHNPDEIYMADMAAYRALVNTYHALSVDEYGLAIKILGEEYFA